MSSAKLERVVIVGGGLGGLAAALSFYYIFPRHNLKTPSITVYERDKIENSRRLNEGYTLTLRNDKSSGSVQALKTIDEQLYRDIRQMAVPNGDENMGLKLGYGINCDINPTIKFMRNENDEIFRVARYNLRNRLVEEVKRSSSISKIDLQWNSHVIKAGYDKVTNKVTIELKDGRRDECDLLIVAEGIRSSVRRYMSPEIKINFRNHILLTGVTQLDECEQLPQQLCPTLFGITGQGVGVFLSPIDEKSFFWCLTYHSEEPKSPPLMGSAMNKDEQENLINEIVARSMNCLSDEFRSFVKRCDRQRLLIINCYDKFPHRNPSEKHVIFIGDALHPMSPMGGNGANMAIRDGVEFVEVLINNYGTNDGSFIERSIKEFDRCHTKRSVDAIKLSYKNISAAESTGLGLYVYVLLWKIMAFIISNRLRFKRLVSLEIGPVIILLFIFFVKNVFYKSFQTIRAFVRNEKNKNKLILIQDLQLNNVSERKGIYLKERKRNILHSPCRLKI